MLTGASQYPGAVTATPLNLMDKRSTVKKFDLRAEELGQRVVPSILGSTLSVAVALPLLPEQGIAAPEPSAAVNDAAAAADGADGVTVS